MEKKWKQIIIRNQRKHESKSSLANKGVQRWKPLSRTEGNLTGISLPEHSLALVFLDLYLLQNCTATKGIDTLAGFSLERDHLIPNSHEVWREQRLKHPHISLSRSHLQSCRTLCFLVTVYDLIMTRTSSGRIIQYNDSTFRCFWFSFLLYYPTYSCFGYWLPKSDSGFVMRTEALPTHSTAWLPPVTSCYTCL